MYAPLAPQAQHRIRQSLRASLPAVGSAHLAECLAAALGFRTSVALKTRSAASLPGEWAPVSLEAFSVRLASLGYFVTARDAALSLNAAFVSEQDTPEGQAVAAARLQAGMQPRHRGLHPTEMPLDLLGFDTASLAQLRNSMKEPGLTLFVGPVGVGSGTTAAALVRDTLTLPKGARPDLLAAGSIRNRETARTVLEAAARKRVVATIHELDAMHGIQVLGHIADRAIPASITGSVFSQASVRMPCPHCSLPWREGGRNSLLSHDPEDEVITGMDALGARNMGVRVTRRGGCDRCAGTGKAGWTVLIEQVPLNREVLALVANLGARGAQEAWKEPGLLDLALAAMTEGRIDPQDKKGCIPLLRETIRKRIDGKAGL